MLLNIMIIDRNIINNVGGVSIVIRIVIDNRKGNIEWISDSIIVEIICSLVMEYLCNSKC